MSKRNKKNKIYIEDYHGAIFNGEKWLDLHDLFSMLPDEAKREFEESEGTKIREKEVRTCCICGKKFLGYGCNANPVVINGICCDECDRGKVIPERIRRMNNGLTARIGKGECIIDA